MATLVRELHIRLNPNEEQKKVLGRLGRQYAVLCNQIADIARADDDIKSAPQLSVVASEKLKGQVDIPWRYVNLASIAVMRTLRRDRDYVWPAGDVIPPVDLDTKMASIKGDCKITDAPSWSLSIAAGEDERTVVPCEVEVVGGAAGSKAGGARLYWMYGDMWEVRVAVNVDEIVALKADYTAMTE